MPFLGLTVLSPIKVAVSAKVAEGGDMMISIEILQLLDARQIGEIEGKHDPFAGIIQIKL
jgi:hypothetical protein